MPVISWTDGGWIAIRRVFPISAGFFQEPVWAEQISLGESTLMKAIPRSFLVTTACLLVPAFAYADSTTVNANADIYAAGTQSTLATGDSSGQSGTVPGFISLNSGTSYLTFSASGSITINGGGNNNDPDGVGAAPATSFETGYGSISGMTVPNGGYLVGVFIGPGGPTGTAPASLDYTSAALTTSESSYSPLLDQAFFIGDGLTGDGTGSVQDFYVPTGATELYLGISDACNYSGGPSCYGDNSGTFSVSYDQVGGVAPPPSATPEPSSLALLGTGVLGVAGALRRRFMKR
jgi:hypothetical protein